MVGCLISGVVIDKEAVCVQVLRPASWRQCQGFLDTMLEDTLEEVRSRCMPLQSVPPDPTGAYSVRGLHQSDALIMIDAVGGIGLAVFGEVAKFVNLCSGLTSAGGRELCGWDYCSVVRPYRKCLRGFVEREETSAAAAEIPSRPMLEVPLPLPILPFVLPHQKHNLPCISYPMWQCGL